MGKRIHLLIVLLWMSTTIGFANAAVGDDTPRIAAVQGTVRLEGPDGLQLSRPGVRVGYGERLSTGEDGRAKVVFADGIVDLAPASEIILRPSAGDEANGGAGSLVELIQGRIRLRSVDAGPQSSRYQVETPTAVVIRGTDYIVMYDPVAVATEVVGLRGDVEVVGRLAVVGGTVAVGPRESTMVRRGQFPVSPEQLDDAHFEQALLGFVLVGTGGDDGLAMSHPAISGRLLSPRDLPDALPGDRERGDGVVVDSPRAFLADELSPDLRINDEPLLEYERRQPGLPLPPSTGGVVVEF